MNATNYNAAMREVISGFNGKKPKILLHACCAPCSSSCLERLKDDFDVTLFFYNPNIEDGEYFKRRDELIRLAEITGWAKIADCEHDTGVYYLKIKGLETCAEGGERCEKCFGLRLERTAAEAKKLGFEYFCTTLTLSPLKNAALINGIGLGLEKIYGVKWLPSDFKKENGYIRSVELSRQYSLYRQNYCGCVFSQGKGQA